MTLCSHPVTYKVIERLGMMRENGDGTVTAPLLEWFEHCTSCRSMIAHHVVADPEETPHPLQPLRTAAEKVAAAFSITRSYIRGE